jgi:hypothetical protein
MLTSIERTLTSALRRLPLLECGRLPHCLPDLKGWKLQVFSGSLELTCVALPDVSHKAQSSTDQYVSHATEVANACQLRF